MDLQEKYDELDNIISTLDYLIGEITMKDYIEDLNQIKWAAENEKEDIEPILIKECEDEKEYQHLEYRRSVL